MSSSLLSLLLQLLLRLLILHLVGPARWILLSMLSRSVAPIDVTLSATVHGASSTPMLRALAIRVILHGNINGSVLALGHDHLSLLEYVISRYSGETLLASLPQHMVELGLRIQ